MSLRTEQPILTTANTFSYYDNINFKLQAKACFGHPVCFIWKKVIYFIQVQLSCVVLVWLHELVQF